MTKGEILRQKVNKYKEQTGYAHFTADQRKAAGISLNEALKALPDSDNKEIMKDYMRIRKGYDE